jgi:hypothetical protein
MWRENHLFEGLQLAEEEEEESPHVPVRAEYGCTHVIM